MSSLPRLPVRPRPNPDESLSNYCLRVSEDNGYRTPTMMLSLAGISNRIHVRDDSIAKVAALVDADPGLLGQMAYVRQLGEKQRMWVRGHRQYRLHEVTPKLTRVCLQCIKELGYAKAIWDIRLFVCCPKHKTILLDTCPACGKTLTWIRRGLLTCACGHRLSDDSLHPASEWTIRITSLIERTILHGSRPGKAFDWCPQEILELPTSELLPFLTYWVAISSRLKSGADSILSFRHGFDISKLSGAIDTVGPSFAEWPLGHARLIAQLFEQHHYDGKYVKPNHFLNVVGGSWISAQSNQAPTILRNEIKTYLGARTIYNKKGKTLFLHPRHIIPFRDAIPDGISLVRATELLSISESLFERLVKRGIIKKLEMFEKNHRAPDGLFDLESVLAIKPLTLSTHDYRDAAIELAVSGQQFSSMVRHGLLEVAIGKKKTALGSRFRIDDVAALNTRFAELVHPADDTDNRHYVPLKEFWPNGRNIMKTRECGPLVEAILRGGVTIARPRDDGLGIGNYLLDIENLAQEGFCIHPQWLRKAHDLAGRKMNGD